MGVDKEKLSSLFRSSSSKISSLPVASRRLTDTSSTSCRLARGGVSPSYAISESECRSPTAELLSKAAPYTELLGEVTKRLLEMVQLVTAGVPRKLVRIGVISTTFVTEDEMPPGISRYLKYLGKPWHASPDPFRTELTVKLEKSKHTVSLDRCVHIFVKPEDSDGLVQIRLDWQRLLPDDRTLSMGSLPELLENAKTDALAYFEDIGEGGRFDD